MSQYFPKPYEPFGGDINVKVDLSNYATKSDLKNATGIDTSKLAAKSDLVSLKAEVDKLDIDKLKGVPTDLSNLKSKAGKLHIGKLETTPVDLSKLSNLAKNDVIKKTEYNAKIKNIEDKIPNITNLAIKTTLNIKKMRLRLKVLLKYLMLVIYSKELTMRQKLMKLKRKLLIIVMINTLLLQNFVN